MLLVEKSGEGREPTPPPPPLPALPYLEARLFRVGDVFLAGPKPPEARAGFFGEGNEEGELPPFPPSPPPPYSLMS